MKTNKKYGIGKYSINQLLPELMNTPSPSGYESGCIEILEKYLNTKATYIDRQGNTVFYIPGTGEDRIQVLLTAHMDELGYQIQEIHDTGLLSFITIGGVDKKVLPGQDVEIHTKGGKVKAVIGKKPIHCETPEERDSVCKLETLLIDAGCTSKDEVKQLGIEVGDIVVPRSNANPKFGYAGSCISGRGLDDKSGIVSCIEAAAWIKEHTLQGVDLYVAALTQEEVGLRGATKLARAIENKLGIEFTYAIDVDVTFCTDEGKGVDSGKYGNVKLGSGPVIFHGPDCCPRLVTLLTDASKSGDIKVQHACSRPGGTNTTALQDNLIDAWTGHIGIPNRNMHTPVEICSWRDIEGTVKLIIEFLENLK